MLRKLKNLKKSVLIKLAAVISSAVLLAVAFPPVSDKASAWMAIIPLFLIARQVRPSEAFRWGFLSGFIFWLISISWLLRLIPNAGSLSVLVVGPLVAVGWIFLSAYCALYTGLFMSVLSLVNSSRTRYPVLGELLVILVSPLIWVGCEYFRSIIFTGFPWNSLGISQYQNLPIIQIAEWGGVFAVSAVVVLMNASLAGTIGRFIDIYVSKVEPGKTLRYGLIVGLAGVACAFIYGVNSARTHDSLRAAGENIRISAVQPNIPQASKWSAEHEEMIYRRLAEYTELVSISQPDLIVWPETALPYCLTSHEDSYYFASALARKGVPILIGSMELDGVYGNPDTKCFNSSFLMGADGRIAASYRKVHLVPFGEFFPFDKTITLFQKFVPIGVTCYPGKGPVIFNLKDSGGLSPAKDVPFAALICFEDIMAYVARDAVRSGARLLVNQTNDAWFDGSSASIQHLSHCVFRCVENRVPAVRSGNTGFTCFIDSCGRIDRTSLELLKDGSFPLTRYRTAMTVLPAAAASLTFYTRYGDAFFAIPSAILTALAAAYLLLKGFAERHKRLDP